MSDEEWQEQQEEESTYEEAGIIEALLYCDIEVKGDKLIFTKPEGETDDPA